MDYLVGKTDQELDSKTLNRVLEVKQLPDEDRKQVFMVVDALIRDFKAKKSLRTLNNKARHSLARLGLLSLFAFTLHKGRG